VNPIGPTLTNSEGRPELSFEEHESETLECPTLDRSDSAFVTARKEDEVTEEFQINEETGVKQRLSEEGRRTYDRVKKDTVPLSVGREAIDIIDRESEINDDRTKDGSMSLQCLCLLAARQ